MDRKDIGKTGEKIAKKFLQQNGYTILEQNFQNRYGEIDIIAADKNDIVFIEVKTRKIDSIIPGELAVDRKKQLRIIRSALSYIKQKHLIHRNIRFDVISLNGTEINLIKNAFEIESRYVY